MANEQSATFRRSVTLAGVTIGGSDPAVTFEGGQSFSLQIGASQTDKEIAFTCDVSESRIQAIVADKDCTIKTNDTGSPAQTIALKANTPLIWDVNQPTAGKVFTTDVTKLYVTTGGTATILKVAVGQDATP